MKFQLNLLPFFTVLIFTGTIFTTMNIDICKVNPKAIALENEPFVDADGDGYDSSIDVDDNASSCTDNAEDTDGDGVMDCLDLCLDVDFDSYGLDNSTMIVGGGSVAVGDCLDAYGNPCVFGDDACQGPDCNDSDSAINPDASEIPGDGVDQNCDGLEICYNDIDNDGYRTNSFNFSSDVDCLDLGEAEATDFPGDCNDADPSINPGATEIAGDGVDQNCDGQEICYNDIDKDGYRTNSTNVSVDVDCQDSGEALSSDPDGDCNDSNASVNPSATEIVGNGIDDDCDGFELCYCDQDDDGVRPDATCTVQSVDMDCNDAGEAVPSDPIGDCDDSNANVYPGAPEIIGNGIDENCDTQEVCYVDADNDGYRTNSTTFSVDMDCNDSGEATPSDPIGDCDDLNASVYPGTTEIVGNGIDDDCDGFELCYCDQDDDGVRPNATCTVQSVDMDCNDAGEAVPSDPIGDCDDSNASVYPGAPEIIGNGIDENCDTQELCYVDADDDGYRTNSTVASVDLDCMDSGEATPTDPAGDCNDGNAGINPGVTEICNDGIDNDCDGNSYGPDSDGDGICDEVDNCSSQYNPIQSDTDNDGVGDSCDPDFIDVENIGLGTNTPKTKFHLKNGKLFLDKISGSLMMKSPNGSCWLLTIDNSGNISSMKVDCPG